MFFMMGMDPRQKELNYNEMVICDACGSHGRYRVWVSYSSGKAHTYTGQYEKNCPHCGYTTSEDFQYCPKCGHPF